jgi:SPP1 family predicted phage head-tail adaptor|nr:MAG TPA: Putative head tail adaptor [Caudoviricetes sp.]
MDISKLNQRIEIQKGVSKTDEVGNVLQQWQVFYSCFASVKTAGGKERQKGDKEEQHSVAFAVRFCKKLSELSAVDYRIMFRGKNYNIVQVDFADYGGKTIKIKAESEESYGSIGTGNDE